MRSTHTRAVSKQSGGLFETEVRKQLVRAFCNAKSGWNEVEDSGVSYADHTEVNPLCDTAPYALPLFQLYSET